MEPNSNQNVFNMVFINTNNKTQQNPEEANQNKNINIQFNNITFPNPNQINPQQNLFTKKYVFHPNKKEQMVTNNDINKSEENNIKNNDPSYQMSQNFSLCDIQLSKKGIMNSLNDQKTVFIIQKVLQGSSSEAIKKLVLELQGNYRYLILDKYGNLFFVRIYSKLSTQMNVS